MISVEERLRAATRAAASTVTEGSAPELRLPVRRYSTLSPRRREMRWAAPLTAALAVVAVVVAAAVVHGTALGPETSQRASAGLPRYFVAIAYPGQFRSSKIPRTVAIVGNTATGRPIATITPPKPYDAFVRVTAAANDTRYVLAAAGTNKQDARNYGMTRFYELRITSSGSHTTVKMSSVRIPVLGLRAFSEIALSPNGTRLAVTHGTPAGLGARTVRVYDLATGKARTWALPSSEMGSNPALGMPSWEANGKYLALDVSSRSRAGGQCLDCVRLLDTATAGGDILADSTLAVRSNLPYDATLNSTLIAPDGRRVLRSANMPVSRNSDHDRPWIYAYNARSGALVRSMTGNLDISWTVLWSSRDGRAFIVSSVVEAQRIHFITAARYADGRWHKVPLPARTLIAAW